MELRHLRSFVVLAEERHFGRAAGRLRISQQALSKRLVRLESLLDARLVERTRRDVALTAAGERLLAPARRVLDGVDAAVATVRMPDRPLRVDVLDEHLWPLLLVREVTDRGGMAVDAVMREHGRDAVDMLRSGDADVAFGRAGAVTPPWPDDVVRRLVRLEPVALLVGEADEWADRSELAMSELSRRELWFPMTGAPPEWRSFLDELADEHGLRIDYGGSTLGFGYWVERVTRRAAPPTFIGTAMAVPRLPRVRVVPLVDPVPVFPWWAMWRRRLPAAVVDELLAPAGVQRLPARQASSGPERPWLPAGDREYLDAGGRTGRPRTNRREQGRAL